MSFTTGRRPDTTRAWNFLTHIRQYECDPVANRVLVPDVISEVFFDFPGLLLPRAKEIISMRAKKKDWQMGQAMNKAIAGKTQSAGKVSEGIEE